MPPVPSACQGGDSLSKPDGKQTSCFPGDLLKGACSRTWSQETQHPVPAIMADGCFCILDPAANLSPTGVSRQSPVLQLCASPAPVPWRPAALGAPTRESRCCSQQCPSLPVPGVAVGPPLQNRLPTPPVLPVLALAALATGSALAPTLQAAARPPGRDRNAAAGRISLSSWRGFPRV